MNSIVLYMLLILVIACDATHADGAPVHQGALFRTHWEEFPSSIPKSEPPKRSEAHASMPPKASPESDNLRERIAAAAIALLDHPENKDQFGAADVQNVFKQVGLSACAPDDVDVPQLVKTATGNNSYATQAHPRKGDLVLFHNQYDRNRNGQSDDWFTGVGIVVERNRKSVVAVTRTGSTPKEIVLSPKGPMVHTHREKTVNSFVKVPTPHDPTDAQYLAGQLYAGFIDVEAFAAHCAK
ncbi:MAG: hypothetical protein JXX29_21775 [Deltaproteobacteria bacterium]|nr:hypothetical protein [Deltaproteobacteria bacterium]MBN2674326.1 hypothetical protein [Deltaproteobacteria bacterium]